ncbi:MAG: LysE family translocator [Sphingomonas sp.]|uniref:LysE family translocator n=1 Tax=Sphingomonas sp. TaxID=28214 RepID=UPI0017BB4C63|nr:LysE family translocator [Sphingomonas sp.]MBA3667647.1 LysE family translocator [Sphingomonas sp.]
MSLLAIFAAWVALATVATVSPGPDTALVVAQTIKRGRRAGIFVALGIGVGNLWYAALFGFGLIKLLSAQPTVYTIVKVAGAAYLAWIGFKMVRSAFAGEGPQAVATAEGSPFRQGLISNVLNPKIALFFLAAIPQFAGNGPNAPFIGVALIAVNGLINFIWLTIVAIGVQSAGNRIGRSNFFRWIEGLIGVGLMGIAARVAFSRSH